MILRMRHERENFLTAKELDILKIAQQMPAKDWEPRSKVPFLPVY